MTHYEVFYKKDRRINCNCGRCVNLQGFKTELEFWHAAPLTFTQDKEEAQKLMTSETLMTSTEYGGAFIQTHDKKILTQNYKQLTIE